jgi:hypothetical protein
MLKLTVRFAGVTFALLAMLGGGSTAQAGWDNVFQVACWDCRSKPRTSNFAPAPAPVTSQRIVTPEQRCYYEPVTVMKPERYTEEVPVQVKSYYWDPVTTYSYSTYYDDCSGKCQKVQVPRTSYVRKEQCNTVMKYVERVRMVPVEVQRKVCETRQVVTYYGPITKTYECDSCELAPSTSASPRVDVMPGHSPNVSPLNPDTIAPQQMPGASKNSFQRSFPGSSKPSTTTTKPETRNSSPPPASIKVNAQTTSTSPMLVRGEVVANDRFTPRPGTKVVFMNAANHDQREYVTADTFGNFDTKLTPGDWYVYLGLGEGKAQFYKKVTITPTESPEYRLVSR